MLKTSKSRWSPTAWLEVGQSPAWGSKPFYQRWYDTFRDQISNRVSQNLTDDITNSLLYGGVGASAGLGVGYIAGKHAQHEGIPMFKEAYAMYHEMAQDEHGLMEKEAQWLKNIFKKKAPPESAIKKMLVPGAIGGAAGLAGGYVLGEKQSALLQLLES